MAKLKQTESQVEETTITFDVAKPKFTPLNLAFLQGDDRVITTNEVLVMDRYDRSLTTKTFEEVTLSKIDCKNPHLVYALGSDKDFTYNTDDFQDGLPINNTKELQQHRYDQFLQQINYQFGQYKLSFNSLIDAFRFCRNINETNISEYIEISGSREQIPQRKKFILKKLKTWQYGSKVFNIGDIFHIPTNVNITKEYIDQMPQTYF